MRSSAGIDCPKPWRMQARCEGAPHNTVLVAESEVFSNLAYFPDQIKADVVMVPHNGAKIRRPKIML